MCEPRRALLEVLKWVEAWDLLQATAVVSGLWSELSACEELWYSLSEDAGLEVDSSPKATYRENICTALPVISQSKLQLFLLFTKKLRPLITFPDPLYDDYCMAAVLLPGRNLLVCGGRCNSASLFSLTGTQTELRNMRKTRAFHSALYCGNSVYVFAGAVDDSRSAEKLQFQSLATIASTAWQELQPMCSHRSACSPCLYAQKVYLCGGNSKSCEMFNLSSESFYLLPITLPEMKYGCVAFMIKGELVILSENYITRYRVGEVPNVFRSPTHNSCIWTSMQQRLVGGCVYSAEKGVIRCFDLSTCERIILTPVAFNSPILDSYMKLKRKGWR